MIVFHVITIFPEAFGSYLEASILGKAQQKKLIKINLLDLRRFTKDKRKTVDDVPYGGGPGMVIKIEPVCRAVNFLKSKILARNTSLTSGENKKLKIRTILFSTRGKKFDSKVAKRLSRYDALILICGRYEGVDERVALHIADEEISIGDYILSGGELPAMVLTEAVSRHIPGVLGKRESLEEIKGSYPVYTRPPEFFSEKPGRTGRKLKKNGMWRVPQVLLSGDHKKIAEWREKSFF